MEYAAQWNQAIVSEPMGFVDDALNTVGAVVLRANTPTILSLDPGADFELNTDIIHAWKIVFQDSNNKVIGDADYTVALREIQPFILDQQNGSILIRALSDEELETLHVKTIFT